MFVHPQFKNFSLKPFLKGFSEIELRNKLAKIFPNHHILFTDSGRSAFRVAVEQLGLKNSEMLIPAYLCDIFEPIFKHYNIRPIFLDIDLKTFHVDLSNIESKITSETKSILICHTYGLPFDINGIIPIAKKYNLKIIEDCAHLPLWGLPRAQSRGDCAFFSFSKLFPTINGGMLISKNPIKTELPKYKPGLSNLIKFLKLFSVLARFSELFRRDSKGIREKNSRGILRRASKGSLRILNWYLNNFEEQVSRRIALAKYFQEKLKEIGFQVSSGITHISALVPENINRDELFNKLRKKNIFCSRIWQNPIYKNLPNTAEAAKRIINFPLQNWFTEKDIDKIISCILSGKG